MRRKLTHAVLGVSLLAAVVVGAPTTVGAQGGWQGFTATSVPTSLHGGGDNQSPAFGAATTDDLGGAGVDLWTNNHAELSEALLDYSGGATVFSNVVQSAVASDTHGVAFSDVDGDGDDDLFEVMGRDHDNELQINTGGTLAVRDATGLEDFRGRGRQPLFVDIDNDNDMDVIVSNLDRTLLNDGGDPPVPDDPAPSELYLNNGDGTAWTKVDDPNEVLSDGSLRYLSLTSTGPGTAPVVLTHNTFALALDSIATGSATLTEGANVETSLGPDDNTQLVRDVAIGDIDGDLRPDMVVARQEDFGADENFEPGDLPIGTTPVSTNQLEDESLQPVSNDMLADNCRAVTLADYDNDGDLDIFGGCAMLEPEPNGQDRNIILLNDGAGNFTIGAQSLVPATGASTATVAISADFNEDGWVDTYVAGGYDNQPGPDHIYLNQGGNSNHWLQIDLVGSNPDAMGAQVFVGTDKWQVRETGHRMHNGQDMKTLHFGLGSQTAIAPIQIRWPDGTFEQCTIAGIDRRVTITQGGQGCANQTQSGLIAAVNDDPDTGPGPKLCRGRVVTVDLSNGEVATQGDDVILGTEARDIISGLGGNDVICGLGGDDVISGGDGIDRIYGGDGRDDINGGEGRDRLFGGRGSDTMFGGSNRDVMVGNSGRDTLVGEQGRDRMNGSTGNDTVTGGGGDDQLKGGLGNDVANGGRGTDSCRQFETVSRCEV